MFHSWEEFVEHIERLALLGARQDTRADKSDWLRIWAAAREVQDKARGPAQWRRALEEEGDGHGDALAAKEDERHG